MDFLKSISIVSILNLVCSCALFAQANQEFIFVHGLWSSSNAAWGQNSFRQRVIDDYQPSKANAINYNSNSFVKNGAGELKTYLKRQGYNNAVAIAHSKGGLVTRKYFLDNSSSRRIDRLVTIGTPHRGTYLINRGDDILYAAYKGVAAFVAPNHYNQNWLAIAQNGGTLYVPTSADAILTNFLYNLAWNVLIRNISALKDMGVGSSLVNSLNSNSGFESKIQRAALYCDEDSPELWRLAATFTGYTENSVIKAITAALQYRRLLGLAAFAAGKAQVAVIFFNVAQDLADLSDDYVKIITDYKGGDNDAVIRADLQQYPNTSKSQNFKVRKTNHFEETGASRAYNQLQRALAAVGISQPPPLPPPPPPPLTVRISPAASSSQLGNPTRFKAKASGGTGGYSYAWFWRWSGAKVPGATAWTQFGSSKKVTFSPWQSKELKVEVTDSNGIKVEDIEIW